MKTSSYVETIIDPPAINLQRINVNEVKHNLLVYSKIYPLSDL